MEGSTISLEKHQSEVGLLKNEINHLKEQLEWCRRQIFGKRSEKMVANLNEVQLCFDGFDKLESKSEEKQKIAAHEKSKPKRDGQHKISLPSDMPVERVVIDIPEEDKICKETGKPLIKIGEEVSIKLAHKPGSYYIKEIVRPKYALPADSEGGIVTASLPESLLTRCQADESFLAEVIVKKFADHLPLYRQAEILSRVGVGVTRQLLSQWVLRCSQALKPLFNEMNHQILASNNIFIDESPVDMLDPGQGKTHQAYMWVMVGGKAQDPPYRIYNFRTNRQHSNASELLKGYCGTLHSDKYGAYEKLANDKKITWNPCWSHIRRKFFEAETGDPAFREWVLRKIKYLFMFERIAWERSEEERLHIRVEKEMPIIDELIQAIKGKLINGKILPKSKLKEALGYFCSLIPHLKNYINDPWSHLDNNVAERAIRPLAIGRKNWLFVGSEVGGEAAAVFLSLVQTCRALKINPREYLEDVMRRIMSHNSQKLYELLPDQWAQSKQAK